MVAQIQNEVMGISGRADSHDSEPTRLAQEANVESSLLTSDNVQQLVDHASPWVRAAQLPELFCSWDLAYRCTRSGWLKPIIQGKRRTIYRLADVLSCMRRIEDGELPIARRKGAVR